MRAPGPSAAGPASIREALDTAASRLAAVGVESAAQDAELLLRHILGWDRARLLVEHSAPLPAPAAAAFRSLVEERARRRPLQHLTGTQEFWRHTFRVTPDVLIPRPETEILVEAALGVLRGRSRPKVVDVGTGSGCIALCLAAERPDAEVYGLDISPAALAVAEGNARRLGLEGRVWFRTGDLLEPLRGSEGRFDLVASNPPYVDASEAPRLAPEVREFEPAVALFAPGGRHAFYRLLTRQAAAFLGPGGFLLLEIGMGMDAEVARLCEEAGFRVERVIPDLQAILRTVVARRPD